MTSNNIYDNRSSTIPPYIGWSRWTTLIDHLRQHVPSLLDQSYFKQIGFSGTHKLQAIGALTFFGLIDEIITRPNERLHKLVSVNREEYRRLFKDIVMDSYHFCFEKPSFKTATPNQLQRYMKDQGAKGTNIEKCVAFFLAACREVDIQLSPSLSGGLKKNRKIDVSRGKNMPTPDIGVILYLDIFQKYFDKLPEFSSEWSDDLQNKWFDIYRELTERILVLFQLINDKNNE